MNKPCPICGEQYEARHEVDHEYLDLAFTKAVSDATDDIHFIEVENRRLIFYIHDRELAEIIENGSDE